MKKSIATLALVGLFLAPAAAEKVQSAQAADSEPAIQSPAEAEAPVKRKTRKKKSKRSRKAAGELQQSKAQ